MPVKPGGTLRVRTRYTAYRIAPAGEWVVITEGNSWTANGAGDHEYEFWCPGPGEPHDPRDRVESNEYGEICP